MDVHVWYEEHKRNLRDEFLRELEPKMAERERATREQLMRELETKLAETQLQVEVKPLVHLFERRLGRPLTSSEREVLAALVKVEGSDRIADLVLDLSGPELEAWLERSEVVQVG